MKRNTPTNEKAGHPTKSKPAKQSTCSNCSGTCAKAQALRLDDRTIHALYFGVMAAVFEAINLREQERTGKEFMNLRDSLDSAMETADSMMSLLAERRAK